MSVAKRYSVTEVVPQRHYTRDAILSAVVTPKNPDMLGSTVWDGDTKAVGAKLAEVKDAIRRIKDKRVRDAALTMASLDLQAYANEMESGSMKEDSSGTLGTGAKPEDLNDANRELWDRAAEKSIARDSAAPVLAACTTPKSFGAAVKAFYANQPRYEGRPFGKG